MAIAFQNSSAGDPLAQTSPVTISKPPGTSSTDILVVVFSVNATPTIAAPSGWTAIATGVGDATLKSYAWWAPGSVANLGFTFSGTFDMGWSCVGWTGVDNATPIDATGTTATNTGSATISAPAVTVVTNQAWHVITSAGWNAGVGSAPSFTAKSNGSVPNSPATILYNTTPKGTGSTGTVTVTQGGASAGQHIAVIPFALRPAATAATPQPSACYPDRIVAPLDVIAY